MNIHEAVEDMIQKEDEMVMDAFKECGFDEIHMRERPDDFGIWDATEMYWQVAPSNINFVTNVTGYTYLDNILFYKVREWDQDQNIMRCYITFKNLEDISYGDEC